VAISRKRCSVSADLLKQMQRGKQVLLLFKIEELIPSKDSDLKSIRDLLTEYEPLKGHRLTEN
jgi:hypothetical protein